MKIYGCNVPIFYLKQFHVNLKDIEQLKNVTVFPGEKLKTNAKRYS